MSGNCYRYRILDLESALQDLADPEACEGRWGEIRAWLQQHAPHSDIASTVEFLARNAEWMVHALQQIRAHKPGFDEPLTAIAREIEGDDSVETALRSITAWSSAPPSKETT